MGNAPVKKFNAGSVSCSVWENESTAAESQPYHSVSIERRYKDNNGEWKGSNSFRKNDLPKAVLVLQEAFKYVTLKE